MELTVINVLLTVSFLITAVLSTLMAIRSTLLSSKFLAAASFGAVVWIVSMIIYLNVNNLFGLIFSARMLYIAGAIIITNFVYFTYTFLRETLKDGKLKAIIIGFPLLIFSPLILFSDTVIKDVNFVNHAYRAVQFGGLYFLYAAYMIIWSIVGYYYLIRKAINARDKTIKRQLTYVGLGTISAVTFGLIFDIILPGFGRFDFYWLGPVLVTFFVIFASYAIARHHLFNVKVIATELFSTLLFVVLVIRFVLSDSTNQYLLNGIIALSFLVFDILLIRSVWKEVGTREKVEKLAEQLRLTNEKLKQADLAKSEFLSIAAHQLRTPLTGIKGYISMFLEGDYGKFTPEQTTELEGIFRSADRLTRLIDVFLNVSRIETGRLDIKKEPVQFMEIVSAVRKDLAQQAAKKGLEITIQPPSEPLPLMMLDRDKIHDVTMNLVDNAIKYTPKGWVNIRVARSPSLLTFSVQDSGLGISANDIDKLFQKFTRAEAVTRIHTGGSGLGLFIAKKIVEAHGGRICLPASGGGGVRRSWQRLAF